MEIKYNKYFGLKITAKEKWMEKHEWFFLDGKS
jgi:hypothetical protein